MPNFSNSQLTLPVSQLLDNCSPNCSLICSPHPCHHTAVSVPPLLPLSHPYNRFHSISVFRSVLNHGFCPLLVPGGSARTEGMLEAACRAVRANKRSFCEAWGELIVLCLRDKASQYIGLTGVTPWAPPLSSCSGHSGDKLDPSTSHNQPESPYLLSAIEGQSHLI